MSWSFETTNREGVTTGFVVPRRVVIERRLNAASTVEVTADAEQGATLTMGALFRGYRTPAAGGDRVLQVTGQLVDITNTGTADGIETVTAAGTDAFGMLAWRHAYQEWTYGDPDTGTGGLEPRVIISDQIDIEDGVDVLGLYINPAGASGPPRIRVFDFGKNVQEAVQQLAEVDDGFYFRIDPYSGDRFGRALFSEMVLTYPGSGTDRDIVFEYGHGGNGNLRSAEVKVAPPSNYVRAYGAGEPGSQIRSTLLDTASIETYGLYHTVLTLGDVEEQETLDQHALDALRPSPQITYSCSPIRFGPSLPRPWDDFDVGDTVLLRLNGAGPYMTGTTRCRVNEFQVTVEEDGVELLTSLTLEVADA